MLGIGRRNIFSGCTLVLIWISNASCAAVDGGREQEMEALSDAIHKQVAERGCQHDAQCASIAFGIKSCGGPIKYLVYSSAHTDVAELNPLIEKYNHLNKRLIEEDGLLSTCEFISQPVVACVRGECQATGASFDTDIK